MEAYDRHELKIIRRGVSIDKVISAYKHFGSLRPVAKVCGVSKDTVAEVLKRYNVEKLHAVLPKKASYNPKLHYSEFAKWHKAHASDQNLPHSLAEFASLSGVNSNVVKCYFYRRRKMARKILSSLPDLRKLSLSLQDIEGKVFSSKTLESYHYAIDRYSQRAALQGHIRFVDGTIEVTVLIPSIDQFAGRVKKLTSAVSGPAAPKPPSA